MRFSQSLRERQKTGLIPVVVDFKPVSPKDGDLFGGRDPVETAVMLESLGAPALSAVTESHSFGGSMALLRRLCEAVTVPVLRKDFIRSVDDIRETAEAGAAAVLLICACMDEKTLTQCFEAALQSGIEPLTEAHTPEELRLCRKLGAGLIGINNRDILALEKDDGTVARTEALARLAPKDALLISESGIETPEQARKAVSAGADAVLVGTALWKAKNMALAYRRFSGESGI